MLGGGVDAATLVAALVFTSLMICFYVRLFRKKINKEKKWREAEAQALDAVE